VTLWVAGFDIIYALMDREIDLAQDIRSIPARFGAASGRRLPLALHGLMALLLLAAGTSAGAGPFYYAGVALALALLAYEAWLLRGTMDVFALNERVFVSNMIFSVAFLGTTLASFAWRA